MKYWIITFGCQMNISDAERVSAVLESAKYKKTSNINEADLIVVTMCSVRQSAVDRVHGLKTQISKLKSQNHSSKPKAILTGCVLKRDRKKMSEIFDYIINIKDIKNLPAILKIKKIEKFKNYLDITPKYTSKFSANIPIMTGCNNFCAYCVVPYAREREISRPAKEIILEIKNLIKNGYKEIWLLGQNVNSYSNVLENNRIVKFPALLKIVNDIPGDFWIRFTSSHPKDFNDEVVNAMAKCKKITPYLNLPVQSGDDKVLKSMNRHYTVKEYKDKINKLREKIPDIAISTDVIVGFPGETKKQFENTAKLFREIKFDMAYINKYSPRAGTAAAKLKGNVSVAEKKRREKVLTKILKQTALEKNKKLVGKTTTVLIEGKKGDFWLGKNDQYKTVKFQIPNPKTQINSNNQNSNFKNLIGEFVCVKITKAREWALEGELI